MFESWSHKSLDRARRENKPIFLSIAPHGTDIHIDDEITQEYVCIRVDPDEHAELEYLYGSFAKALTGETLSWPLNLILDSDQRPITLASGEYPDVEVDFDEEVFGHEIPTISLDAILDGVDPLYGGFDEERKHPVGYVYSALIRAFPDDPRSWFFAKRSLESISKGAICDPITMGIARSADRKWDNPDPEMRLCDNALLAKAFLDVGKKELATQTCQFILDHLQSPHGEFYASAYGIKKWDRSDIDPIVAEFHSLPIEGKAFLKRDVGKEEFAEKLGMEVGDLSRLLMLEYRRLSNELDINKKILPLWNALATTALAEVGNALQIEPFITSAQKAFEKLKPRRFDEYAATIEAGLALGYNMEPLFDEVDKRFKADNGPYYMVDEKTPIYVRRCPLYDELLPCGNSIHINNLVKVGRWQAVEDILRSSWEGVNFLSACQKHGGLRG